MKQIFLIFILLSLLFSSIYACDNGPIEDEETYAVYEKAILAFLNNPQLGSYFISSMDDSTESIVFEDYYGRQPFSNNEWKYPLLLVNKTNADTVKYSSVFRIEYFVTDKSSATFGINNYEKDIRVFATVQKYIDKWYLGGASVNDDIEIDRTKLVPDDQCLYDNLLTLALNDYDFQSCSKYLTIKGDTILIQDDYQRQQTWYPNISIKNTNFKFVDFGYIRNNEIKEYILIFDFLEMDNLAKLTTKVVTDELRFCVVYFKKMDNEWNVVSVQHYND